MTSAHTRIDYGLFLVADSGLPVIPTPGQLSSSNGLVCATDHGAAVITSIDMGDVLVSVQALVTAPPLDWAAKWEEAADISLTVTTDLLAVESVLGDVPALPSLAASGPGTYRLRVYARGRKTQHDRIVERSDEEFLLQAWPAPLEPERIRRVAPDPLSA